MKSDEVDGNRKNGKSEICAHQRMVDNHDNEEGKRTENLLCRECGEVIHDPVKA
ncbi:MAG: hypothetical protein NPIRA06_14840 [Nitrospirales bacterium]|nr:MAG: hypothetical protein NPIRA06_14840 [Nitrospirales bacterium]